MRTGRALWLLGGLLAGCRLGFAELGVAADAAPDDDGSPPLDPDAPAALAITSLVLHDVTTDLPIGPVIVGSVLEVNVTDGVALLAEVADQPGSVLFVRNGEVRLEGVAPFTSGGDTGGDMERDTALQIGTNQIAITAYELAGTGGARGPTHTAVLELRLVQPAPLAVVGVEIIDAAGAPVVALTEGAVLSIATLPPVLDVRALTDPPLVGSVRFGGSLPWAQQGENWPPYRAYGDAQAAPVPGMYLLEATPYPLGGGGGSPGPTFSVRFELVP